MKIITENKIQEMITTLTEHREKHSDREMPFVEGALFTLHALLSCFEEIEE